MSAAIGVGIIGTGIHGSRYARHILADRPGLRLAAIARRSAAGAGQARDWGCRLHADWRELVSDPAVAAVVAAVTPDLNPAIAAACAAAGKPLLVEKPLAVDPPAGEAMLAAFAKAGLPLTVAQTLRYNSVILALRERLGELGSLHGFSANQRLEPSTHPWLEDPAVAGGGVILHTAVHMVDALRFITGREVTRARAWARRRHNPNLEDHFCALLELSGGAVGSVDASKVGASRAGRYEFVGETGQLEGDQIHGHLALVRQARAETLPLAPPAPTIPLLLADWERCLRGEGPNPIPGEEGLAALRICEACRRSAAEDRELAP